MSDSAVTHTVSHLCTALPPPLSPPSMFYSHRQCLEFKQSTAVSAVSTRGWFFRIRRGPGRSQEGRDAETMDAGRRVHRCRRQLINMCDFIGSCDLGKKADRFQVFAGFSSDALTPPSLLDVVMDTGRRHQLRIKINIQTVSFHFLSLTACSSASTRLHHLSITSRRSVPTAGALVQSAMKSVLLLLLLFLPRSLYLEINLVSSRCLSELKCPQK